LISLAYLMALSGFPLADHWLLPYRQPAPARPLQQVA
jgi:hypothetical protein